MCTQTRSLALRSATFGTEIRDSIRSVGVCGAQREALNIRDWGCYWQPGWLEDMQICVRAFGEAQKVVGRVTPNRFGPQRVHTPISSLEKQLPQCRQNGDNFEQPNLAFFLRPQLAEPTEFERWHQVDSRHRTQKSITKKQGSWFPSLLAKPSIIFL